MSKFQTNRSDTSLASRRVEGGYGGDRVDEHAVDVMLELPGHDDDDGRKNCAKKTDNTVLADSKTDLFAFFASQKCYIFAFTYGDQ